VRFSAARYGAWAVVAGASEGIGAAFARALTRAGIRPVLVARRSGPLEALATELAAGTGRPDGEPRTVAADLATDAGIEALWTATADLTADRTIGLLVINAAYAPIGPFLDRDEADLRRAIDLNCVAPVRLARHYLPGMVERGRGGVILLSSLAGQQGSPGLATYAATKAFGAVLAEGLWAETRGQGVDVLACVAGAVATPGLTRSKARLTPGTVSPNEVAAAALAALGRRPRTVPGRLMKVGAVVTGRLLPRRAAIALIARASSDISAPADGA
jgi:uncharacterized protein